VEKYFRISDAAESQVASLYKGTSIITSKLIAYIWMFPWKAQNDEETG